MKNNINFKTTFQLLALVILFSFQSCTKKESIEGEFDQTIVQNNNVVDRLLEMGYNLEDIEEYDDFYLVEGDLMFPKDKLPNKQAHSIDLVSRPNVQSMTVFVDASMPFEGTDNWRPATTFAINALNTIEGSIVNFIESPNPFADIVISSDGGILKDNVLGSAGFPTNDQPWNSVLINLNFNSNTDLSELSKQRTMTHELGHCIGLHHTNSPGSGSIPVPCTSSIDANSVMNGGSAGDEWMGFTTFDRVAVSYLYPTDVFAGFRVKEGGLSSIWHQEWGGPVKDFQIDGDRIAILTGDGALRVKEGGLCANWVVVYGNSVSTFQLENDRIAIRTSDGTLRVKEGGLSSSWIILESGVKDFQLEKYRVAVRMNNGALKVKQGGLSSSWVQVYPNGVLAYQLEGDRIGILLSGGALKVKEGSLSASWISVESGVKDFQLEDNRIAVRMGGASLKVKQGGLSASWVSVYPSGVQSYKLDGDRIGILLAGGALKVKEGGLSSSWTQVWPSNIKNFQLDGNRIGIHTSDNVLRVKEGGLDATWVVEWDNEVRGFQLNEGRIAMKSIF